MTIAEQEVAEHFLCQERLLQGDPPKTLKDLVAGSSGAQAWNKAAETNMIPQMTMATEDYNRIVRMMKFGRKNQDDG